MSTVAEDAKVEVFVLMKKRRQTSDFLPPPQTIRLALLTPQCVWPVFDWLLIALLLFILYIVKIVYTLVF